MVLIIRLPVDGGEGYMYVHIEGGLPASMIVPWEGEGSNDFGQGQAKTKTMVTKWNEEAYGEKDKGDEYKDLWGIFKHASNVTGTVDPNKWFVPSKGEWSAFAGNLGINSENYADLNLSRRLLVFFSRL